MKKQSSNPAKMVSYLDLHLENLTEENTFLHCTLRLGSDQYNYEDSDYKVVLNKVLLHVDLSGYEMVPGTKFGEHNLDSVYVRSSQIETEEQTSTEATVSGKTEANVKIADPLAVSGSVLGSVASSTGAGRKKHKTKKDTYEGKARVHRVLSRGDNYWDISDVDDDGLQIPLRNATYLNNQQLCGLARVTGSNRLAVAGVVMVRKCDVELSKSGFEIPFSQSRNKDKVLKNLTAEAVAGVVGEDFSINGFATLSIVEVKDEES